MTRILLRFSHGLGDVCQFSVVLKHIRKHRPDWIVDIQVGRGKHTALRGLCNRVWHDQEPDPAVAPNAVHYDSQYSLGFYENYCHFTDRPNSKVTNCLQEVFNIPYDATLGRYECQVSQPAMQRAGQYLRRIAGSTNGDGRQGVVLIHYEGNTSPSKKNLAHWQVQALCDLVIRCGRVPVILDWDRRSPLPDGKRIFTPGCGPDDPWGGFGSGDAETIAAMIRQAEAYIGVDSGPGKLASTTDTPTLICWRGHHPIQFHDPAANTVHLIPEDHRRIPPCCDMDGIAQYFEAHYQYITYSGDHGLVGQAQRWLAKTLGVDKGMEDLLGIQFVLPNGIGDVMWALHKIRSVAAGRPIDVVLAGDPKREIDRRAVPFLRRFPFIREISVADIPILEDREHPTDNRGRYRYVSDGVRGQYHFLMPNRPLEAGRRLEDWLADVPCDWSVIDEFNWDGTERGRELGEGLRPFVCFYLGPETGHCDEGHNRGWLWEPRHWIEMGAILTAHGFTIAVIGASYDRSFWEKYVRPGVNESGMQWVDLIGLLEIGETFRLLRECQFLLSYQCGLGILHHYLGGRGAMWWRRENDSCHPEYMVSFSERMADAWTNPKYADRYIPLIYGRENGADILAEMKKRGWLDL